MRRASGVAGHSAGSTQAMAKAAYLEKFYSVGGPSQRGNETKKKKKKRRRSETKSSHISVVDEDLGWPAQTGSPPPPGQAGHGENTDDGPVVENAAEVHHQLQLLQGLAKFSSQWESEEVPEHTQLRHYSDDDSPPRRRPRHDSDNEILEQRPSPGHGGVSVRQPRQRHDSSDDSPPRRTHQGNPSVSPSMHPVAAAKAIWDPPRQHGHDCEEDSLPRRSRARQRAASHETDDESPPRRLCPDSRTAVRAETESGARQAARHDSDGQSPVRRHQVDSASGDHSERHPGSGHPSRNGLDDESPPRRQGARGSGRPDPRTHTSSDRPKLRNDASLSTLMHAQKGRSDRSPDRRYREPDALDNGKAMAGSRLGQGAAATGGLLESHVMAQQIQQKKQDDRQRILDMDPSQSGRGATSTFRVDGKIVSKEQYEEAMAAKQPKRKSKYLEEDVKWKGGLAQRRAAEAQQQALEREGDKKFQREFDEDADARMQEELRMDDPMAQYFASKQQKQSISTGGDLMDAHATELSHASGFKIPQVIPAHSWIKRGVQPLPNRHNIKPGKHWDGVSRGNGFEQKFVFQYQHNRAERERDRYVLAEDL